MDLRRARLAIAAAFLTQGLVFISLTTRLPRIQDRWDLGELALSGVLLMMVLLAGAGSLLAERLAPRLDSAVVLRAGLLVIAVSVAVLILAPTTVVFVARPGGVRRRAGAGRRDRQHAGGGARAPDGPGHPAVVPRRVDAGRGHRRGPDAGHDRRAVVGHRAGRGPAAARGGGAVPARDHGVAATATETDVPWRAIVMVGLALVVFYTVDTAAATWGPVYLDDVFDAPEELVALATLPYLVASGLVRLMGDRLTEQVGAVRLLRVGAAVAFVSLADRRRGAVVAGGGHRLHAARLRRRGGGAAELLGRRRTGRARRRPRHPAGAGRRGGGAGSTSSTTPARCSVR